MEKIVPSTILKDIILIPIFARDEVFYPIT
jgi:hypothetical protein